MVKTNRLKLSYSRLLWLFIIGSLLGVVIEGIFCVFTYGRWETHVVSLIGPFCILYGLGAAGYYAGHYYLHNKNIFIQFLIYATVGFILELFFGLLLEFVLGMRAWDYTESFMNFRGHVCLEMTVDWGILGVLFSFLVPYINKGFDKVEKYNFKIINWIISIIIIIDLCAFWIVMVRYSNRHYEIAPKNVIEEKIDYYYPDEYMKDRFIEWRFLDDENNMY